MKGIFISGTGTDVGKTVFATALTSMLINNNIHPIALKPIQTGCLQNSDGDLWEIYRNFIDHKKMLNHYNIAKDNQKVFTIPSSPHIASLSDNKQPLQIDEIEKSINQISETPKIIEGAGGLMVPINQTQTFLDLIIKLEAPVIIVSDGRLGCINHTLMSLSAIKNKSQKIGFVFCDKWNIVFNENCKCNFNIKLEIKQKSKSTDLIAKNNKDKILPYKDWNKLCSNCLEKCLISDNSAIISKFSNVPFMGIVPYSQKIPDFQYINQDILNFCQ